MQVAVMELPLCAMKAPSFGAAESIVRKTRILSCALLATLSATIAEVAAASGLESSGIAGKREDSLSNAASLRDAHRYLDALQVYEDLLTRDPRDHEALRMRVLTLSDIGNSHQAWQLYRMQPDIFTGSEREQIELDRLARLIGWSQAYGEDEDTRLAEAIATESEIVKYLDARRLAWKEAPRRLRVDHLILLNRLGRHEQVAQEYQELLEQGQAVPDYALGAVGDSLLTLRRPEDAIIALQAASAADPENAGLQVQLAYARLESEQPGAAIQHLAGYRDRQPDWKYAEGAREPYPNWSRHQADTTLAMLAAYTEDLPAAQDAMEHFVSIAPANAEMQASLGSVYQMRGWPERALERYRMAGTLDKRNVAARIGQVEALTTLNREDLARPLHDELLRMYPSSPGVARMDADWRAHQGWQWRAHSSGGRSEASDDATSPVSPLGSRDGHYGLEVGSPLLSDRWRIIGMLDHRWADFQQRRIHDQRQGVGIAYSFDRLEAAASINHARDALGGTGLDVRASWRPSDTWGIGIGARRHDPDASLQARAAGITADSLEISTKYAPSERTTMDFGLHRFRYGDGNRRDSLSVSFDQRVLSQPYLLLNVIGFAYSSRGSRLDAPYFNPSRDASLEAGLRMDHLAWRDYERHFRHRLDASLARYWQQGHGQAWVPTLRYQHEWQFALGKVLSYGVNWSRPVYDGQREEHLGLDAELRWGE